MKIPNFKTLSLLTAICMLCACTEDEIYPAANFTTTGFVPGFKWKLDASSSISMNGKALMYRWDYNEDQSQFDTSWQTDPVYIPIGESKTSSVKIVTLQIKDADGLVTNVSKEVLRRDFLYFFRHDTIRYGQLKIPYNSYSWINESRTNGGYWMRQNVFLISSGISANLADSLQNGSYLSWHGASTLKLANSSFSLPSKLDWEDIVKHIFGNELAGFNLQVNNLYGMGLGLHGYINNNQLLENNQKCYYWTSTEIDENNAWAIEIQKNYDTVKFVSRPKNYRCKVRLLYHFNIN